MSNPWPTELRLQKDRKVLAVTFDAERVGKGKRDEAEAKEIDRKVGRWTFAVPSHKATALKTKLADLLEPAKGS